MNASVSLGQRLAIQTMQKVEDEFRVKKICSKNAGDIFLLLTQIYLNAADGAHIAAGILEGDDSGESRDDLMKILSFIKSNLIYIGAVIDGKK